MSLSSASEAVSVPEPAERLLPLSPTKRRVAISVGGATVLLASLDAYVVITLFPKMVVDLGLGINDAARATPIITYFLLGYMAGMPLLGGLSDRLGRRTVVQVCLGGFLIGSIVTASSLSIAADLNLGSAFSVVLTGRVIQGIAGGALLPVTMALVADLWSQAKRPAILGAVGAAQELGSVLGPLYGVGVAAIMLNGAEIGWRGVFWLNVPLTVLAMVAVHFTLPDKKTFATHGARAEKVDIVGGLLLAGSLAMLTLGLYNGENQVWAEAEGKAKTVLPPHGPLYIEIGVGALVVFAIWQIVSKTKLVDLRGLPKSPFFAVVGANFIAGTALMITLFDISLFVYGLKPGGGTAEDAAKLLVHFLIALPIGALLGGWLAPRFGVRPVAIAGFIIAALGYWAVSTWPANVLDVSYHLPGFTLPRLPTDLAVAGLGLGLVIAPISTAVLHIVPPVQHGVASASAVVARTIGMLAGLASLTAYGSWRFDKLLADVWREGGPVMDGVHQPQPTGILTPDTLRIVNAAQKEALLRQYHEIFSLTSILCLVAVVIALAIRTKKSEAAIAAKAQTQAAAQA